MPKTEDMASMTSAETRQEQDNAFVLLHRPTPGQILIAVLILALCTIGNLWRAASHLSTHVFGGSTRDAGLYFWLFEQNRKLFSYPWFDTQAFFPYGMTLAWSDNFILPSLFFAPLAFVTSDIAAYNTCLLSALFLNGFCTYLLAHRITGAYLASLITGGGFSLYSYFIHHAGHPQLLFFFWIPLSILCVCNYIASLRKRWLFSAWICVGASFLCSVYYAIFLVILLLVFFLALSLVRPNYFCRRQIFDSLLTGLIAAIPLLPFIWPYLETKALFGERKLYEPFFFAATIRSYFSTPETHWLYGWIFSDARNTEAILFPGFTLGVFLMAALKRLGMARRTRTQGRLALLSIGCLALSSYYAASHPAFLYSATFFSWLVLLQGALFLYALGKLERNRGFYVLSNRNYICAFLYCGLAFFIFSLGPLGNVAVGQYSLSPFTALFYAMPGVSAVRAAGRFGVVAVWCVFMTLPFLLPLIRGKQGWGRRFYLLTAALLIAENVCTTYPLEEPASLPAAYAAAAQNLTEHDSLIAVPVSPSGSPRRPDFDVDSYARHSVHTMLWAQHGRYRLINGYSGQLSALLRDLGGETYQFPDRRSLQSLSRLVNLTAIAVHTEEMGDFSLPLLKQRLAAYPELSLAESTENEKTVLLSYTPETRLTESYRLWIPSHPGGTLHLEMKALYQPDTPVITVHVFIEGELSGAPLASVPIPANDAYEQFAIRLPETEENMKPLKLSFSSQPEAALYLRQRTFIQAE